MESIQKYDKKLICVLLMKLSFILIKNYQAKRKIDHSAYKNIKNNRKEVMNTKL